MIHGKNIVVVMPACNAEKILRQTLDELPHDLVDEVVLVDDASSDSTIEVAQKLGINAIVRPKNMGYGANQKTCCGEAMRLEADVVVTIHPDYRYSPRLVTAMAPMIVSGHYDRDISMTPHRSTSPGASSTGSVFSLHPPSSFSGKRGSPGRRCSKRTRGSDRRKEIGC